MNAVSDPSGKEIGPLGYSGGGDPYSLRSSSDRSTKEFYGASFLHDAAEVSTLTAKDLALGKHAYRSRVFNPAYMKNLQERMLELVTATGWSVGEIASIAGVTSSAVSQWIGNGNGKQSKSIGNIAAAFKLEKASGFSALWLAQGKGSKLIADAPEIAPEDPEEEAGLDLLKALELVVNALSEADEITREQVVPLFSLVAREPAKAGTIPRRLYMLLRVDSIATAGPQNEGTGLPVRLDTEGFEPDGKRDRAKKASNEN